MKAILVILVLVISASLALADGAGTPTTTVTLPLVTVMSVVTSQTMGQYQPTVGRPGDMQEVRIFDPACARVAEGKLFMLATRLFAQKWVERCQPVWGPLPWPSRITQTYGACPQGESLFYVDEAHGQWRPGWTWWRDAVSGVHLEKCTRGNWVASTFVMEKVTQVPGPERVIQTTVTRTVTVPQIVTIPQLVVLPQRQFIQPAGVSAIWTPALPVPVGSTSVGPWQDKAWLTLFQMPDQQPRPKPPNDGTCGPPPPGGVPSPPPGDAAMPGVPGSGAQGPGLGDGNGYTPLPAPPPGYGSGDAALPGAGPLPPGPGQSPSSAPLRGNYR